MIIFLMFAQNIDCEAVLTYTHDLCFDKKIRKNVEFFFSSENNHFYSREILLYIAWACLRNDNYSVYTHKKERGNKTKNNQQKAQETGISQKLRANVFRVLFRQLSHKWSCLSKIGFPAFKFLSKYQCMQIL